jgi:7-cyano-7-deazaguanine synthase
MNRETVIVLSGGIDSVTMAHMLVDKGKNCRAIYVNYGKDTSTRELEAAKLFSLRLDIPLEVVEAKGITQLQLGYLPWSRVLADEADIKADDTIVAAFTEEDSKKLASVPAGSPHWFQITGIHHLMSTATYLAQITNANEIAVGITKEQSDAIPGLKEALDKWGEFIQLLNPACGQFSVIAPLIDMTKDQIVETGNKLNIPYQSTWSCFFSKDMHCGECNRCIERKEAFKKSGINDPLKYIK